MDVIRLVGMSFFGYHGVMPGERRRGQPFVVDVEMHLDLKEAATRDELALTVNYARVYRLVQEVVEGPPSHLIETLAERIAGESLSRFPAVQAVTVRVRKPHAPVGGIMDYAEVEVHRVRDPARG